MRRQNDKEEMRRIRKRRIDETNLQREKEKAKKAAAKAKRKQGGRHR